ncbi:MAG: hypothetical protein MJY87_11425 [Fibrobacter sp.]|nr:hypothetical protein [Fibrobacter sp.]
MMNRLWKNIILAMTLLTGSAVADFIQSPIPPSSRENSLLDSDGDGRLDQMNIKFLGTISGEYLDQMVDSLTFDWMDSSKTVQHYAVGRKAFVPDSSNNRRITVDLSHLQSQFDILTSLSDGEGGSLGNVKLYLAEGSVFDIAMRDKMSPVVKSTFLRSYRGKSTDSLVVNFSERVDLVWGCQAVLEFKKKDGSPGRFISNSNAIWNANNTSALFLFEVNDSREWLLPQDSIRLMPRCVLDSIRNASEENARFRKMEGFYPLEVMSSNMVVETAVPAENLPIFQMQFKDPAANVPNENEWGVAMDVLGPEFENAVRDALGLEQKTALDLKKLKIFYNLRIYTNLGAYVVGTSGEVYGNDSRFNGSATRLFLKWNLMDGTRKRVATGAYISNAVMIISYDGQVVFRNDVHHGPTTQIFGVKRK